MNALTKQEVQLPALAINEQELLTVLENSLYPGAQKESIKLVVGYCKAADWTRCKSPSTSSLSGTANPGAHA